MGDIGKAPAAILKLSDRRARIEYSRDDVPDGLMIAQAHVKRRLELKASCTNAYEDIEILEKGDIRLIFLDINMTIL